MQTQENNHACAHQEPASRTATRRMERQNNTESVNTIGAAAYENPSNSPGNIDKTNRQTVDGGTGQAVFGPRPSESGPSRPFAPGVGYSPRGIHPTYRDPWMSKSIRMPGAQYYYPPGVYGAEFVGHEVQSPRGPYPDYDNAGYPYFMTSGVPYQRRHVPGQHRTESRFAMELMPIPSHATRMVKVDAEPSKSQKQPPSQGMKFLGGATSTAAWYERSAASFEKSKEIFEYISKRCESQECSHADQEKLVHITKERTVRQLDFNAASQAMKAAKVMEKRWSTEPNGEGFRTAAKDMRGLIENNSIDATRLMYPITEVYVDPCEAEKIAEESESAEKKATYMKQYADATAQAYGIPLYTPSDNFLEYAEQAYLPGDTEVKYSGPSYLDDQHQVKHQGVLPTQGKVDQIKNCVPQTSLALFVNNPVLGGDHVPLDGHRNVTNTTSNLPKVPQVGNILIKDAHLASMGTFDRKSNTWNPHPDSFSPNYDSYALGHLPWAVNDDPIHNGGNDNVEELSSGGMRQLPANVASEACSSKEESKSAAQQNEEPGCVMAKHQAPLCYCGFPCQKRQKRDEIFYWGCKASKCHAEMPITNDEIKQADIDQLVEVPKVSKSGRKSKPSKRLLENMIESKRSSQTGKCSDIDHDCEDPRKKASNRASPVQNLLSKNPLSFESSGLKDSGTVIKVDSYLCRKSSLCDRVHGHRGKCSKKRNSPNSSAERQDKKSFNVPKSNAKQSSQFCSIDKSAYHPEEELLVPAEAVKKMAAKSPESKDTQKRSQKTATESTKAERTAHKESDVSQHQVERNGSHEISSFAMQPSKGEKIACTQEAIASAKLLDLAKLAKEEMSKIPIELRCTKRPTCLNINGHVGRCRERPRAAASLKIKWRGKASPGLANPKKKQKTFAGFSELSPRTEHFEEPSKNVDTGSFIMSTSSNGAAKAEGKTNNLTAWEEKKFDDNGKDPIASSGKSKPSPSKKSPNPDAATCKQLSNKLLVSSKGYIDGLHLLKFEFEKLSSEHIRKFYGCSQLFPVEEWAKQKGEYLFQCKVLRNSPPLHSSFLSKSRKNRLAANGCKSITSGDIQSYLLKKEKPSYGVEKSTIHGYGLFAALPIKAATAVTELLGEYLSHDEAMERKKEYQEQVQIKDIIGKPRGFIEHPMHMLFNIDQAWVLDATKAGSCAKFTNHSCSPNCEINACTDPAGAVHLILQTLKDVQEGEELTFNYEELDALHGFTCSCKSVSCRKRKSL